MISDIAKYTTFSTMDLKKVYREVEIDPKEKPYTDFEACGRLYQFRLIPFVVTDGVASLQWVIDKIITDKQLQDTCAYIDNVTVCCHGNTGKDRNLKQFLLKNKTLHFLPTIEKPLCLLSAWLMLNFTRTCLCSFLASRFPLT